MICFVFIPTQEDALYFNSELNCIVPGLVYTVYKVLCYYIFILDFWHIHCSTEQEGINTL